MINLIKKTKSLCPECLTEIDAAIYEESKKAVIRKKCEIHGEFSAIVENDVDFYKKALSSETKDPIICRYLVVPITYKCNLNCKFCFSPDRNEEEPSLERVKSLIDNEQYYYICFSGGEPTMHPGLTQLISYAKFKGKEIILMTNAIKLASEAYVRKLKKSGVDALLFSLNGLDDKVLQQIDGGKISSLKKKAFKNVIKNKIITSLSFSWLKGVNDGEFKKLLKLCLRNSALVFQLRCRIYAMIGRAEQYIKPTLSDFVSLLADSTGIPKNEFIEFWPKSEFPKGPYRYSIDFFNFILSRNVVKKMKRSVLYYPAYLYYLYRHLGFKNLLAIISGRFPKLFIHLFIWPDKYDVDLQAIYCLDLAHATAKGETYPFFETLIKGYL